MTISVVVPFRAGCEWRERAWDFCRRRYDGFEVVIGECAEGPYNRAEAIVDGALKASGEILVVGDADVFCDGIPRAVQAVVDGAPWAVPHHLLHRLSPESTETVLVGGDWKGLSLSTDNRQDSRPYIGHETGTLLVIRRDVLLDVPPDVRFAGWGSEDGAWSLALRKLAGRPWRGIAPLVHLWHPAQPRKNRVVGNDDSAALLTRYRSARTVDAMRALVDEGRRTWPSSESNSSTTASGSYSNHRR